MKKREMEQYIRENNLKCYYVIEVQKGDYVLLHGENDPLERAEKLQLEAELRYNQFKCAMELAFKRNPDLRERYGHISPYLSEALK